MLLKRRQGWEMPESRATAEALYWRRRDLAKLVAAGPILLAAGRCMEDAAAGEQPGIGGRAASMHDQLGEGDWLR